MEDYKELIKRLRVAVDVYETKGCALEISAGTCTEIADAIEQLAKERDTAVKAIPHNCFTCKRFPIFHNEGFANAICNSCYINRYNKWEWRGVQNEAD